MSGRGSRKRRFPMLGRRDGEHLLVLREVRGEEDAEEDLGELDRLEREARRSAPTGARPSMGEKNSGATRKRPATSSKQVAVALQVPRVADHEQGEDVEHDAQGGPGRLRLGLPGVPAGDDDVADPVEQHGQGEDDGVGVAGPASGWPCGPPAPGRGRSPRKAPMLSRDLRLLAEVGDDVERDDQQRAEEEQSQFGPPLGLRAEDVARERRATGSWTAPGES